MLTFLVDFEEKKVLSFGILENGGVPTSSQAKQHNQQ